MVLGTENGVNYFSGLDKTYKIGDYIRDMVKYDGVKPLYTPVLNVVDVKHVEHSINNGAYVYSEIRVYFT